MSVSSIKQKLWELSTQAQVKGIEYAGRAYDVASVKAGEYGAVASVKGLEALDKLGAALIKKTDALRDKVLEIEAENEFIRPLATKVGICFLLYFASHRYETFIYGMFTGVVLSEYLKPISEKVADCWNRQNSAAKLGVITVGGLIAFQAAPALVSKFAIDFAAYGLANYLGVKLSTEWIIPPRGQNENVEVGEEGEGYSVEEISNLPEAQNPAHGGPYIPVVNPPIASAPLEGELQTA